MEFYDLVLIHHHTEVITGCLDHIERRPHPRISQRELDRVRNRNGELQVATATLLDKLAPSVTEWEPELRLERALRRLHRAKMRSK